jgi:archaellum biogenesis protein FlaJ (TadC family)
MSGGKFVKVLYFLSLLTLLIGIIAGIVTLVIILKPQVLREFEYEDLRYKAD